MDAAAVIHDGAHEAALGADQRVVQLGGNGDLCLFNIGLEGRRETGRYWATASYRLSMKVYS